MRDQLAASAKLLQREDALLQREGRAEADSLNLSDSCLPATSSDGMHLTDSNPSEGFLGFKGRPANSFQDSPDIDDELRAMGQAADGFQSHLPSVTDSPEQEGAKAIGSHCLGSQMKRPNNQALCQQSRKIGNELGQNILGFADENAGTAISERQALLPLFALSEYRSSEAKQAGRRQKQCHP